MQPGIRRQFGMEGRGKDVALPDGHDPLAFAAMRRHVHTGQHVHIRAHRRDERRADEDGPQGSVQPLDGKIRLEAVHLTAEGIAPYRGMQQADARLRRKNAA